MKVTISGQPDRAYKDGLELSELEDFVAKARAIGIPGYKEATVTIAPVRPNATKRGAIKKIELSY